MRRFPWALWTTSIVLLSLSRVSAQTTDSVVVSIAELNARPGDRVLVPVVISGLASREVVSGEVKVAYPPALLHSLGMVRRGSLLADQRWLAADRIDSTSVDRRVLQVVFAAATGFSVDGELFFAEFAVDSSAAIGTSAALTVFGVSFNNGAPPVRAIGASLRVVSQVIRAGFTAQPRRGLVPLEVRFFDNSSGQIDSHQWTFGDGQSSTETNPVHRYLAAGAYTVSLTVRGLEGADTETKTGFIEVLADTVAPEIVSGPQAVEVKTDRAAILWITDEPADSFVEYALSEDYAGARSVHLTELIRQHRVTVSGLQANTRYYYRVRSTDAAGNASDYARGVFRTRSHADDRPPVVTQGPAVEGITDATATVCWRTNEVSTSMVEYATTAAFTGALRVDDPALVDDHRVPLTGLSPNTLYYYRVRSADGDGNLPEPSRGTFRTLRSPDLTPPVIITGPLTIGRTHRAATVKWVTDEPSTSQVEYGTGTDYGQVAADEGITRVHLVRLTALAPSTLYHARVSSADAAGNTITSGDFEFTTQAEPDLRPPRFSLRPCLLGRFVDRLVIRWETDEPCAGSVEYGDDIGYGSVAHGEAEGTSHTAVLTDLRADREYHFRVSISDLSGNGPVYAEDQTGRTSAAAVPLQILQGPTVANRGEDRVTLRWRTSRPGDQHVLFGAEMTYGSQTGSADLATDHEVVIAGLTPATQYHCQAWSTDPAGSTATSADVVFTTRAAADTVAPFITRGPEITGLTEDTALLVWFTNEPSDAQVEYGTSSGYGETVYQEGFAVEHRVALTDLRPDCTYHCRVLSRDGVGNGPAVSSDVSFKTRAVPDRVPPVMLSGPGIRDLQADRITILWRTDEPADSFVDYGETSALGSREGNAVPVREHEVVLTGLQPGTTYHYRASSSDLAGNISSTAPGGNASWSRDLIFRTRQGEDRQPPAIVTGPAVIASGRSALVTFTTDEPCIARLAYGGSGVLGTAAEEVVYESEATVDHRIRIGPLDPGTRYLFRLVCRDASGNETVLGAPSRRAKITPLAEAADLAGALEFSTETGDDTTSPVIVEGPTILLRIADAAIIAWRTDEPATSLVDYWTGDLSAAESDGEYRQDHQVYLSGLQAGTSYSCRVSSADFAGNPATVSRTLSFTTAIGTDLQSPSLVDGPRLAFLDATRALIAWQTDEPTTTVIDYGGQDALDQALYEETFAVEHQALLTGLTPAAVYRYQISVTDAAGNGPVSGSLGTFTTPAVADQAPPIISQVQTEQVSNRTAVVAWQTDEPSSSYIYYGTGEVLEGAAGDPTLTTGHRVTLTGLIPATAYRFQVESIDPAGNRSGASSAATLTTSAAPDTAAPTAPATLDALIGLDTAVLSWSAVPAADLSGYTVYRQARNGSFSPLVTGLATTAFVDEGLASGTTYTYYVTAVDLVGNESAASPQDGGTPSIRSVPGAVIPVGAQVAGNRVTLTVTNVAMSAAAGTLTYTFHVSTSELFDDIVARAAGTAQGASQTAWTFSKELVAGQEYWWRARASNGTFDGPWSYPSSFVAPESLGQGDFDGNGVVGLDDFFQFADAFGIGIGETGYDADFDLGGNGRIDLDDFFLFADLFGTVYSTLRPVAGAGEMDGATFAVHSRLVDDEVAVEVRAQGAVGWCGVGLIVGFDPRVLEWVPVGGSKSDFGRGVAADRWLAAAIPLGDGGVALLAHRAGAAPFGGEGSVALLRFRARGPVAAITLVLREGAVQTTEGIAHLAGPRSWSLRLVPERFALAPNYPNPFNPETAFRYDLPVSGRVRMEIFDLLGQRVRILVDEEQPAGQYRLQWDGRDAAGMVMASGVYLCRLRMGDFVQVRRMALVR